MNSIEFEIWRTWFRLALVEPTSWEYVVLGVYVSLSVLLVIRFRRDFTSLTRRRWLLFVALLAAPLIFSQVLVIEFPPLNLLPPPNVPVRPSDPVVPLLGALPTLAAAAYLGAGPALLVGLVSGILRADMAIVGITDPFHQAFFGFAAGVLLNQDYRGKWFLIARQPLVVGPMMAPLAKLLLFVSVFAHVSDAGLSGLDYAVTLTKALLLPAVIEGFAAAVVTQSLYLLFPHLRPVHTARRSPPYTRSLNARFLSLFVHPILAMICVLVYAVTVTTIRMTASEVTSEMARGANSAAEEIPYFIHTGQGLLTGFASDERLWKGNLSALEDCLASDVQSVAFFDQLMLFDPSGRLVAMYPPAPTGDPELTVQEETLLQRVLEDRATQISSAHTSRREEPLLSFLAPVGLEEDEGHNTCYGALLGRTRLDVNPLLNRILAGLQWISGQGEGFLVDSEGRIVSHSDYGLLLTQWQLDEERPSTATMVRGWAYESRDPVQNTRQLVYYLPAEGYPWAVVIRLPYKVVLERAQKVAIPLLFLQTMFGGGLVIVIPLIARRLTHPLRQLAAAADCIAGGDLAQPIRVTGEDEVGRMGEAFEDMRVRLKSRMEDLASLLEISQVISATLELSQGIPFILNGALQTSDAQVARMILLSADGAPQMVMSSGGASQGLGTLDRALVTAVKERGRPVVVENMARVRSLTDPGMIDEPIGAIIALPVCIKERTLAVMWMGYRQARCFNDLEIDFLSTLAGGVAMLVDNARLFEAAEGGRRRLAAILDSITDAVLVTDRRDRVLLVNPAAELAFDIVADAIAGQEIEQAQLPPALVGAFQDLASFDQVVAREVPLPDGRTLYANVSTILGADSSHIGHVAVMRDVTRFKELDELKSEFLSTVSHDLRAPLMFMRGYANMLPAVGDLSDKQRDYVEKILYGVEQINELVGDLLDLGRIETGLGLERSPCHLEGVLIEAVDGMRARAATKEITLRTEPAGSRAVVAGDAALLRRAVTNLVDNAIKYTPNNGIVTVGLAVRKDGAGEDRAVIRVTDTGLGIAPDDQARLFEKFYRIKRRDAPNISGTGLGLAIVKSVIERHEGKVWVDSQLHEGSTFYISLPLYKAEEASQVADSAIH